MNTPRMIAKDKGNGSSMDIVRLIPKDIAIHSNCVSSNCLLLPPKLILSFSDHDITILSNFFLVWFP